EAYFRLAAQLGVPWKNRSQFLAFSAVTMRRVLVDYARKKASDRYGGDWVRVPLDQGISISQTQVDELLCIHTCLEKLEQANPRQAKIVELRFFGGLSNMEIAEHLGISLSTVE